MLLSGTLLTSDKHKISYYHYRNGKESLIIVVHGFYNSKDAVLLQQLAKYLESEYDVFMFDFRGHGKSSGLFSWMSREERDFEAALGYLKGKYKKIGIIAFSLGGSICINTLAKRDGVDSLVCVSVPCEFRKIDYWVWALDWGEDVVYTLFTAEGRKGKGIRPGPFWLKKERPIQTVTKITIPILYIHGEKDWVIKPWHSQALFEKTRSKKKLVIIKNGPHAEYLLKDFSEAFVKEVKDWFKLTLIDADKGTDKR